MAPQARQVGAWGGGEWGCALTLIKAEVLRADPCYRSIEESSAPLDHFWPHEGTVRRWEESISIWR